LPGARACNWRNKAIAPTGNIGYVASTVSSVAKCLPKGSHLKAEVGFLHRHIRPRRRDKFLVSDDFPGPLRECDQDVERAATERYRLVDLLEQPLGHKQAEWAKRYCVSGLRRRLHHGVIFRSRLTTGFGNKPRIGSATVTMETVVIGYQPQPDKLCELLLLTITNGILQQLTSVSHGFCVNSFGRQRIAAEPKL